jgi:hypothetical protein
LEEGTILSITLLVLEGSVNRNVAYYLYNIPFFTFLWERDSFDLQFGNRFLVIQVDCNKLKKLVKFMLGQRFGEMISKIPHTWNVFHCELFLLDPIDNPEKTSYRLLWIAWR